MLSSASSFKNYRGILNWCVVMLVSLKQFLIPVGLHAWTCLLIVLINCVTISVWVVNIPSHSEAFPKFSNVTTNMFTASDVRQLQSLKEVKCYVVV